MELNTLIKVSFFSHHYYNNMHHCKRNHDALSKASHPLNKRIKKCEPSLCPDVIAVIGDILLQNDDAISLRNISQSCRLYHAVLNTHMKKAKQHAAWLKQGFSKLCAFVNVPGILYVDSHYKRNGLIPNYNHAYAISMMYCEDEGFYSVRKLLLELGLEFIVFELERVLVRVNQELSKLGLAGLDDVRLDGSMVIRNMLLDALCK